MPDLKTLLRAPTKTATIKGIFVSSHIEALRRKKGEGAVAELERRMGRPLRFGRLQEVPIREEVALLEHALDLSEEHGLAGPERAAAAGRLHFTNFIGTPLGKVLMSSMPRTPAGFRTLVHNIPTISRAVFSHTTFRCEEADGALIIGISNCDYPPEHFRGFFEAWMHYWGLAGARAQAHRTGGGVYEYRLFF